MNLKHRMHLFLSQILDSAVEIRSNKETNLIRWDQGLKLFRLSLDSVTQRAEIFLEEGRKEQGYMHPFECRIKP